LENRATNFHSFDGAPQARVVSSENKDELGRMNYERGLTRKLAARKLAARKLAARKLAFFGTLRLMDNPLSG
jgi:hypothetical protein